MKRRKWFWARRVIRNRNYHLIVQGKLPWTIVWRDIILTAIAWSLALYLAWDFLVALKNGILLEFDANPANDLDWETFFRKLQLSGMFSGSALLFLFSWFFVNMGLLARTRMEEGQSTPHLPLEVQVGAYGCGTREVEEWRAAKVLTIDVDEKGQILNGFCQPLGIHEHRHKDVSATGKR